MSELICKVVTEIINPIIILISAGAFVYFLFGLVKFLQTSAAGGDTKDGKNHMIWGIVGLVIIFGAYGIINFVIGTFGITPIGPLNCAA